MEQRPPKGSGGCSNESRAWWRGLYSFSGRSVATLAFEQSLEQGATPVVRIAGGPPGAKEANSKRSSQSLEDVSPALVLQPLGDSLLSPQPPPNRPSPHLRWARHVHSVQVEWLKGQMAIRGPRKPKQALTPPHPGKSPELWGLTQSCERKELNWVLALRKPDVVPEPLNWQEKKCQKARRAWRLQKLRSAHAKWLQDHSAGGPHRSERLAEEDEHEGGGSRSSSADSSGDGGRSRSVSPSSREGDRDYATDGLAPGLLWRPSLPQAASGSSPPSGNEGPRSARARKGRRRSEKKSSNKTDNATGSLSGPAASAAAGAVASSSSQAVANGTAQGGAAAQHGGAAASTGGGGSSRRASRNRRPTIVVHRNLDEVELGQRSKQRREEPCRSPAGSDISGGGSLGSSDSGLDGIEPGSASNPSGPAAGVFPPGALEFFRKANYTPSYVDSVSEVSSKRSSLQEVRAKEFQDRPHIREELAEEEHEDADSPTRLSGNVTPSRTYPPEMPDRQPSSVRSRSLSLESWQEWRTEFPLEVLNTFSCFYDDALQGDEQGTRVVAVQSVTQCIAEALSITQEVVLEEMQTRCMAIQAKPAEDELVTFSCFKEFLDLARSTMERVEREKEQLLFSREELEHMKAVLNRFGGQDHTIAPANLFDVMRRFNIGDIQVDDPDQQRQIADTIQHHMNQTSEFSRMQRSWSGDHSVPQLRRPPAGIARSKTMTCNSGAGALSLPDVVHITGVVVQRVKRAKRSEEFQRERQVRREAGFTPAEMEDLRELYNTFITIDLRVLGHPVHTRLKVPAHKSTLARLMSLLVVCGIQDLSAWEVNILEETVSNNAPHSEGVSMPFDIFMLCMRDVFYHQIGNIQWRGGQDRRGEGDDQDSVASGPRSRRLSQESEAVNQRLEGRSTFGSVMLLERIRRQRKRREERLLLQQSLRGPPAMSTTSSAGTSRKSSGGGWNNWDRAFQYVEAATSRKSSIGIAEIPEVATGSRDNSPDSRTMEHQVAASSQPASRPASRQQASRPTSRPVSRQPSRPSSGHRKHFGGSGKTRRSNAESTTLHREASMRRGLPGGRSSTRLWKNDPKSLARQNSTDSVSSQVSNSPSKDGDGGSILKLKGLPAAEVMLGRKEFRACSVELGEDDLEALAASRLQEKEATSPAPPAPQPTPSTSGTADSAAAVVAGSSSRVAPPRPPVAPTVSGASGSSVARPQRRKKQGQDVLAVVNDAIAKLASQKEAEEGEKTPKSPREREKTPKSS